jgi:hypothetical protein
MLFAKKKVCWLPCNYLVRNVELVEKITAVPAEAGWHLLLKTA